MKKRRYIHMCRDIEFMNSMQPILVLIVPMVQCFLETDLSPVCANPSVHTESSKMPEP